MDIAAIRELLGNFGTFVSNFPEFFEKLVSGLNAAVKFSSDVAGATPTTPAPAPVQ